MPKKTDLTPEQIKEIRLQLGLSPTEFASKLGRSASNVYYFETGKSKPAFDTGELIKSMKLK